MIASAFVFCYMWALAGNLTEVGMEKFDSFLRSQLEDVPEVRVSAVLCFRFMELRRVFVIG